LVEQLRDAAAELIALVAHIDPEHWVHVPKTGVWSPGKDAEHVADGAAYHEWMVRLTIGQKVPSRPAIERTRMTAQLSQPEVVDVLRRRTEVIANLLGELTDQQMDLRPRPPRARLHTLAELIEGVLIGHYRAHTEDIVAKLRLPIDQLAFCKRLDYPGVTCEMQVSGLEASECRRSLASSPWRPCKTPSAGQTPTV
jgi:hypothetical protein